jgi:hypothetical protein
VLPTAGTITHQDNRSAPAASGASKSIIEPSSIETTPPTVRIPWLTTLISAISKTTPKRIRSNPAQLMGRLWKAKNARMMLIPPITPGRIAPGVESSKKRPSIPAIMRMYATFGSEMRARKRSRKLMSIFLMGAPFVSSVTLPFVVLTVRPSSLTSRSGTLSATRSTTLSLTASRSVADTDDRTAFSAQSTFRPRSVAMLRTNAAASFSTFFSISLSVVPPPTVTGWAAPMLVAGAIAATCAAIVMNTPAEAARAPVGAT